jgi:hypothetical protein
MTEIVVSSNALQRVGSSWSGALPGSHLPQSTKFGLSKPVCAARSSSIRIFEVITIFIVNQDEHDERQAEAEPSLDLLRVHQECAIPGHGENPASDLASLAPIARGPPTPCLTDRRR